MAKKKTEFQKSMSKLKIQIEAIGKAVGELRESGISDKVLVDMLHKVSNQHYNKVRPQYSKVITARMVRSVLDGIEALSEYVFPEETLTD